MHLHNLRQSEGRELNFIRMAAIMDCDGWITIQKLKNSRGVNLCLTIGVGNTNSNLTDWLVYTFGGSVYKTVRKFHKHKDYYTWRLFGNKASEVLKGCVDFFLLKRAQADLAITFQEEMHNKNSYNEPCTPEYVAKMQAMKHQMGLLNRKGKLSPAETKRDNTKPVLVAGSEVIVRPSVKAEELDRNDLAYATT